MAKSSSWIELFQLSELFLFELGEKTLVGSTRERGVRGEALGDSSEVDAPLKGGWGRTTLRAACLRVCMGGRTMEGKGKTRLRNEQASENKVQADPVPAKRAKNQNIIFRQIFRKRVGHVSNSARTTLICSISALPPFHIWSTVA